MEREIINRVANSPLITIDLEDFYHSGERVQYDIAENLFQGLILREKDFREFIKEHDWEQYNGKNINIICSADAIVPTWAYMLLTSKLEGLANMIVMGDKELLEYALFKQALERINLQDYTDRPVVIKGCGDLPLSDALYVEITRLLKPVVKSIMYGEPCSTVPVYKKVRKPKA
ncbi:DUF2480 family protein [Roseivirga pacifica]|uniref:DUF2480 family protein n=1 Tax=Roseivirga pacifica TaxID=1267423 RepID=UPI00209652D5|nr:DUF2480 family protein [Roseivirga pacifica]MCO6358387.1 DUF2480 family protein [Roseivirga pacifica]MCO6366149.1 DUF2480 family protein [Roseivirga pacifica]MCO6369300.1 DUF2480 family protein [Roseivirga pacifica]MCO6374118.1 DUF2480 family protein [Roseivirga pacifica]MCO6378494.1 DUF2480 family protein [Roseivirga pacifica]